MDLHLQGDNQQEKGSIKDPIKPQETLQQILVENVFSAVKLHLFNSRLLSILARIWNQLCCNGN